VLSIFDINSAPRIAHTLCKFLFKQPKASDSLLFTTILSSKLDTLRRRGYDSMYFLIYSLHFECD
jgi:hypothetical protein